MSRVCVAVKPSEAEAVAWLQAWKDGDAMHKAMWKTKPGGRKGYKQYICNAHKGCTVTAVIRKQQLTHVVVVDSGREHAKGDNHKKRSNSALTAEQEAEAQHAIDYYGGGSSGKALMLAAQGIARDAGAAELPEQGVEGVLLMYEPAPAASG